MEAMMMTSYGGGGDVSFMMIRLLMMMNVIRLTLIEVQLTSFAQKIVLIQLQSLKSQSASIRFVPREEGGEGRPQKLGKAPRRVFKTFSLISDSDEEE